MEHQDVEAQIAALMNRYATAIDTKNWMLFESCFTTEAVTDYGEDRKLDQRHRHHGVHDGCARRHARHQAHAAQRRRRRARRRPSNCCHLCPHRPGARRDPSAWIDAVGQYEDELVLIGGSWRIARRVFTMTRMLTSYQLHNH